MAEEGELEGLREALRGTKTELIDYRSSVEPTRTYDPKQVRQNLERALRKELSEQRMTQAILHWFELPTYRGFVAPSQSRRALRFHAGRLVSITPRPFGIGTTSVVIDEDEMIPSAEGGSVEWPRGVPSLIDADRVLCASVATVLEGTGAPPPAELMRYLLRAVADLEKSPGLSDGNLEADRKLLERLNALTSMSSFRPQEPEADRALPAVLESTADSGTETTGLEAVEEFLAEAATRFSVPEPVDPREAALFRGLRRFPLSADSSVSYSADDRLLRYDNAQRTLVVGKNHRLWARLGELASDPGTMRALTEAVLSEVNRELAAVTDAEERRALIELE